MAHKLISCFTICFFVILNLTLPVSSGYYYGQQLDYNFYDRSCPRLEMIVKYGVWAAMKTDMRIAASLLRLHFHDCFVNGCDGSVLLDDTKKMKGEKNAFPNRNSVRGFEVIDSIKEDVERACPFTVSCADLLTLIAREAVVLSGGPYWNVPLGRRDAVTASQKAANENLPSPFDSLENITAKFVAQGLSLKDVVVLSGAHTLGFAQCFTFKNRLFDFKGSGKPDPGLDSSALTNLQVMCPNKNTSNSNLAPLDSSTTYKFDNSYFTNLMTNSALLQSDQALMTDSAAAALVNSYSSYPYLFSTDFAASMVNMGNIGVLTGTNGEIRRKCGSVNY
ncbi:peroxidase 10 [Mercurialis annua]|uniref:peroxidase 10 n=1 Tax=Mercurialis annua TaxID=3986 RepID=UPI0021601737|nr:peroxidase 10 [Mercurialis annua]